MQSYSAFRLGALLLYCPRLLIRVSWLLALCSFFNFRELIDRRNELLCEVFALMRYAEMAESSDSPEFDEEAEGERLKQFLERFDLQKKCVSAVPFPADDVFMSDFAFLVLNQALY